MAAASNLGSIQREISRPRSNVDHVASFLEKNAGPNDLVLVSPWNYGSSFTRYYHGAAPWMTLPDVPFHNFCRYDFLKTDIARTNQLDCVRPLLERLSATLISSNRVWLVWGAQCRTNVFLADAIFNPRPGPKNWEAYDHEVAWATGLWFGLTADKTAEVKEVKLTGVAEPSEYERILLYAVCKVDRVKP